MRGARDLDPVEIRILGTLLEKQQTTPESYPLSLNSLTTGCNQKTNREPVMSLGDSEVSAAVHRLHEELLVWKVLGSRVTHWDHNLDKRWELDAPSKAVLTLLFLRGAQTPGELRSRSERMYAFKSVEEVESTLRTMSEDRDPLVREIPRRPGQKESRWMHLGGGMAAVELAAVESAARETAEPPRSEPLSARVDRLEQRLAELQQAFAELREKLGES